MGTITDVRELGIEGSVEDTFDRGSAAARRRNLLLNGATREEAEFLLTQRVELNALTSAQLIAFIEHKLAQHGIKKVVPKTELLRDTYRLVVNNGRVERVVKKAIAEVGNKPVVVPASGCESDFRPSIHFKSTDAPLRCSRARVRNEGRSSDSS
jgi:hypothetical protein